jgi:hypothetical protein
MSHYEKLAAFRPELPDRAPETIQSKIDQSRALLAEFAGTKVMSEITDDDFIVGEAPRLSEFDLHFLPKKTRLVRLPKKMVEDLMSENSQDRMDWNMPDFFLSRLEVGHKNFKPPAGGESTLMELLKNQRRVVSFSNLAIEPPEAETDRHSRTYIHERLGEHNIMGRGRLPLGLGSVPDVGSVAILQLPNLTAWLL